MPENVFRAKGIFWFSDSELRHIFQLSGSRYQPNADEWCTTNRQNQLVFIVEVGGFKTPLSVRS